VSIVRDGLWSPEHTAQAAPIETIYRSKQHQQADGPFRGR